MFWEKLIPESLLLRSEVLALEAYFAEEISYRYTILRKRKGKLDVVEQGSMHSGLELPKWVIKNKIPIVLIVSGKAVVQRKIQINNCKDQDREALIRSQFPALDQEQFCMQIFGTSENTAFICFCRTELVQKLLKETTALNGNVMKVLLGAPAILGLQAIWSNLKSFEIPGYRVDLSNGVLEDFTPLEPSDRLENVKFEEMEVPASNIVSFSGALSYLLQMPLAWSKDVFLKRLEEEHIEKSRLKFVTICCVAILFVISVGNVIYFTLLFDKHNKLTGELDFYEKKYEKVNELLTNYHKNKDIIESSGALGDSKLSEWADKIGQTLPKDIILKELNFNPKIESNEGIDSLMNFNSKHIVALGYCPKSFVVNEWVNLLKMQDFITDVHLKRFTYSDENRRPNFEIAIVTE
jgi:hypothetical protein